MFIGAVYLSAIIRTGYFCRQEGSEFMAKSKGGVTVSKVWELCQPIVEGFGLSLWDVRYVKEGADRFLRVYIDKPEGIDINDCENVLNASNKSLLVIFQIILFLFFGWTSVSSARNVIRQGIRQGEKGQTLIEFQSKLGEIVTATVERIDPKSGVATIKIGKSEATLPKSEQLGHDDLKEGDHIKVYIADVKDNERGPHAIISRTHPGLVKRLFEQEVPEIYDGVVEIKSISREAGSRTKMAVYSSNPSLFNLIIPLFHPKQLFRLLCFRQGREHLRTFLLSLVHVSVTRALV